MENVGTATGYGTERTDFPRKGGEGGGIAEDSTNRFLWHEGEVEGESDDDEIPREWPAYRRAYAALWRAQADSKDAVLGSNWQVLANSCSTTSLGTTGMRRLRQTHMARPEWGPCKVMEQVVCDAIREGKGNSSVKRILNAAAMAYTMGVVIEPVPKRLWKAFKAAQRLEEKSTQEWGSFVALQIMAHQADSELDWCVVGLAVLSTLLGLRVGEVASISFHRLGVLGGTAEFYDPKVHRTWITRTVSGVAFKWLQFCAWIAQRCWNLDKFQRLASRDKLQNVMATLLRGSKWKDLRWHAWRRLGPATMYKAGGKIPSIKAWFRWRSTRTAMAYINCPHPGRIRHPFTTPTPPSYLKGRPWIAGTATRRCTEFWAPEAYDIPEGNALDSDSGDSTCSGSSSDGPSPRQADGGRGKRRRSG